MATASKDTTSPIGEEALRGFFEQELGGLLDKLYGAALRLTRHPADAEDLVAETVGKALEKLHTLQDRAQLRPWLFRIMTNAFISERRKRSARPQMEPLQEEDAEWQFCLFEKLHQPFLLWWGTPEQEFLTKVLREDLERAVDGLPEAFRVVVVLTELEGFTYQEVAQILGVPVGTVRSRLSRGRSLLQKALWRHAEEAGWTRTATGGPARQDGLNRKRATVLYAVPVDRGRPTHEAETAGDPVADMVTTAITRRGGRIQHLAGDALLADFDEAWAALACAVAVQRGILASNDRQTGVSYRIGINTGDVIVDRNDIYGDGINIAARLEALAEPGGICISDTVCDAVGRRLPFTYKFIGEHSVANIGDPVRAYRVLCKENAVTPTHSGPQGNHNREIV